MCEAMSLALIENLCFNLKEELRDVREQLAVYEQNLEINNVVDDAAAIQEQEQATAPMTPRNQLPLFQGDGGTVLSTIIAKPPASYQNQRRQRRRSCQSVTFAPQVDGGSDVSTDGELPRPPRPLSAGAPLCSTRNHEAAATASASDDEIISTTPSRR